MSPVETVEVVEIAPEPAAAGGVGGYAAALHERLAARPELAPRLRVVLPDEDPARLARELDGAGAVLLHYANYGYHRRGCPAALVRAAERRRAGGGRLVTFFHEVYAGEGRPWQSSFWLSPLQRRLAARLARASDAALTSLELYAGLLAGVAPGVRVEVAPVFSTVGEPERVPPLADRRPALVVFGGAGARGRAYGEGREALATACAALGLGEVVDVGPQTAAVPARIGDLPVRRLGALPAAEVSRALLDARAGFLAYPCGFLAKSTIFAAYCAHGLLPVGPDRPPVDPGAAQAAADEARRWYLGHSLALQAGRFSRLLAGGEA